MVCWKCSQVANSEFPDIFTHGIPLLANFQETLGKCLVHSKCPVSQTFPCDVPEVSQKFAESSTPWVKMSGYSECATQEHFQDTVLVHFEFYWLGKSQSHWLGNTLNELLRNIMGIFFGKIWKFPINFLIRKPQSHDLEHCRCTEHFLCWENSECTCNIPGGYGAGSLSISLQFTCNVPAWDHPLSPVSSARSQAGKPSSNLVSGQIPTKSTSDSQARTIHPSSCVP